jgi:NADH-ubiquinone oxidoreductase chain 1
MVGVAFLTLLERRVLYYIQIRKGPNRVGFICSFQRFSDEIRLFSREKYFPLVSDYMSYYFSHVLGLFISLFIWVLMPYFRWFFSFELGLLFFVCCTSLALYTVMVAG